jgi:hypothetical protein
MSGRVNVTVTKARASGAIVRVSIRPMAEGHGDDAGGHGNDQALTYGEALGGQTVTVLKRYDTKSGRFVHWSERDGFNPRRFNPDLLPTPRRRK